MATLFMGDYMIDAAQYEKFSKIVELTKAEFNALETKDGDTLYVITDESANVATLDENGKVPVSQLPQMGYAKEEILSSDTKAAYGLSAEAVPDDVFSDIARQLSESGGLKLTKLWENASPTSEFAAQTVELDLSGYQFIFMDYLLINSLEHISSAIIKVGGCHAICEIAGTNGVLTGKPSVNGRLITVETTGIVFGVGVGAGPITESYSQRNALIIPLQIYGIKGVS